MNNLPFKNLRSCTLSSAKKHTFCLLNMVLKNCLLKCFHDLFVALAVKQMNFLLSFQSCTMNGFLNCYHPTTRLSSLHYLPVAPMVTAGHCKMVFKTLFTLLIFSNPSKKLQYTSASLFHPTGTLMGNYLRETRSRIEW